MQLSVLLSRIPQSYFVTHKLSDSLRNTEISVVTSALDQVVPGSVFVCVVSQHFDAHSLAQAAVTKGASVLITEKPVEVTGETPVIRVRNSRFVLAHMQFAAHDYPADGMTVIGVTGTNGKTSVCWYLTQLLRAAGKKTALFSTVHCDLDGECYPALHTTPPPNTLARYFDLCRKRGIRHIVMEVSSHSLDQSRTAPIPFTLGIFTNLTEDHLDYHGTMAEYLTAKTKLFTQCRMALLNADDPSSGIIRYSPGVTKEQYTFSCTGKPADFISCRTAQDTFRFEADGITYHTVLPTIGNFTVSNVSAAMAAAALLGIHLDDEPLRRAACNLTPPPGRMEPIPFPLGFPIYIDYAHTPDALEKALLALKSAYPGSPIHLLFGCGGDRETQKRPEMGKIASKLAAYTVITADNSRSEDPQKIITDILRGFDGKSPHTVIISRKEAIYHILSHAAPPCVILLAGKGHEDYEIDRNGRHPFSEKDVIAGYIKHAEKRASSV